MFAFTLVAFRRRDAWAWVLTAAATALLTVAAFGQIGALTSADPKTPSVEAARSAIGKGLAQLKARGSVETTDDVFRRRGS